ncbi:hypothetical protein [Flammeovirga sp. OC4]|uniref:hypothetical protein n=1 Tax=Flammeovirga sp. OC4 TaxID=1382345 RepID=UPI0005C73E6A|nr:hypothetical protein [Flammeovirga sp. OC4]
MQHFFKQLNTFFISLFVGFTFISCSYIGVENELDDLTIQNLQIASLNSYYILTPPDERIESVPYAYSNTRDSVFQKLQIELTKIKTVSFKRITLSVIAPSDSSLVIIDSVDVYLSNTLDERTRVGYIHDIPANITEKSLDLILNVNEDSAGLIMKADTAFFITDVYLRSAVRSDSMTFQTLGEYSIKGQ